MKITTRDIPPRAAWALADMMGFLLTDRIVQIPERYAAGLIVSRLGERPAIETYGAVDAAVVVDVWKRLLDEGGGSAQWASDAADRAHDHFAGETRVWKVG